MPRGAKTNAPGLARNVRLPHCTEKSPSRIERALEPVRARLDARRYNRLVSALAMVIGWEALIVQRDIRRLSPAAGEELSVWAARALLRATLEEAREIRKPPRDTRSTRNA